MHSLCKLLLDYATCTVLIPSIRPSVATMMVSLPDVMILIRVNSVYEWSLPRTSDYLSFVQISLILPCPSVILHVPCIPMLVDRITLSTDLPLTNKMHPL